MKVALNDSVILKKESKHNSFLYKAVKASDGEASIGFVNFYLKDLIGLPYGAYCSVYNKHVVLSEDQETLSELKKSVVSFDESKDNRESYDAASNQKLGHEEIDQLKKAGAAGDEVIKQLIENSANFKGKTSYAQEKYVRKKSEKHLPTFTIHRPTARVICEMYSATKRQKILGMRIDILSQMLSWGNVHAHSNTLVVDCCAGLLLGAVLERQGGLGKVANCYHAAPPPRPNYFNFNFNIDDVIVDIPLAEMTCLQLTGQFSWHKEPERPPEEDAAVTFARQQRRELRDVREQRVCAALHGYTWDSLLVATSGQPCELVEGLLHWLTPGRPFAVYSRFLEPLTTLRGVLGTRGDCVLMDIWDCWFREYQVLPERCHPAVHMSGSGGYLLAGFKATTETGQSRDIESDYREKLKKSLPQ